jgi:hypothetical protein
VRRLTVRGEHAVDRAQVLLDQLRELRVAVLERVREPPDRDAEAHDAPSCGRTKAHPPGRDATV